MLLESGARSQTVLENQAGTCADEVNRQAHTSFCIMMEKYMPPQHAEERPWGFAAAMVLNLMYRIPAERREVMHRQMQAWEMRGPGDDEPHAAFDRLLFSLLQIGFHTLISHETVGKLGR